MICATGPAFTSWVGHSAGESGESNAPRRTRTPSLLIRSQALYPVELWARTSVGRSDGRTVGRSDRSAPYSPTVRRSDGPTEVGGTRLELVTSTMSTWRSNQLS